MRSRHLTTHALLTLAALSRCVSAETIVDQPLGPSVLSTASFSRLGQSVLLPATQLDSFVLPLSNFNVGVPFYDADKFITVKLYEGDGYSGSLLQSTTVDVDAVLGGALASKALVSFGMNASPVSGGIYTFEVVGTTGRYGVSMSLGTDPYAHGAAKYSTFFPGFPSAASSDLAFSVLSVSAVPEPASTLLLLTGFAGIVGRVQRRSKSQRVVEIRRRKC